MAAIAPSADMPFKKERLDTELSSNDFKTLVSFPIFFASKFFCIFNILKNKSLSTYKLHFFCKFNKYNTFVNINAVFFI